MLCAVMYLLCPARWVLPFALLCLLAGGWCGAGKVDRPPLSLLLRCMRGAGAPRAGRGGRGGRAAARGAGRAWRAGARPARRRRRGRAGRGRGPRGRRADRPAPARPGTGCPRWNTVVMSCGVVLCAPQGSVKSRLHQRALRLMPCRGCVARARSASLGVLQAWVQMRGAVGHAAVPV